MSFQKSNITTLLSVFKKNSDKIIITDLIKNKKIKYQEFLDLSKNLSNYLEIKKNLKSGDKILICLENSFEFLVLIFACLLSGFVAVPIDPNLPKDRQNHIKKMIKPKISINSLNLQKISLKKTIQNVVSKKPFLILFTSGTTGDPKGILLENNKYISSAFSYSKLCEYNDKTKIYHCLPMFYNAGMINIFFAGISAGSNIVIGPRISPLNIFNLIENLKSNSINSIHLTPEILNSLCKIYDNKIKKDCIKNLQIISTANYLHEETKENFEKIFGVRVLNCYGITEVGGPLTLQRWEDTYHHNSVGLHSREIKFKLKKNKNILVHSPYMMKGYILNDGKLRKLKLNNDYFDTGDIGEYKNGQLFISGRRQDIIKKGGEILSLNLLDNICKKIKNIEDCVHLSVEDIDKGNKIFLFIKFEKIIDIEKDIENLKSKLNKKLKNIELPDRIVPVPIIPRLFNGKINKSKLKDIYL